MVDNSPMGRTLARLARIVERSCGPELSLPQYRMLAAIDAGSERASRLAELLAVGRPAVTVMVDGLVEREWVERTSVDGDRRATRLALTDAGRQALARAEHGIDTVVDGLLDRCDDPDLVRTAFGQLADALHAHTHAHGHVRHEVAR